MWRGLPILLVIASFLGCSACQDLRRARSLEAYTEDLVAESEAQLSVGDCALPGGAHGGFCLVSGDRREIEVLVEHLGLIESGSLDVQNRSPCRASTAFGGSDRAAGAPLEPISRFTANDVIPTPVGNVHLVAIYAGSYVACLEFEE